MRIRANHIPWALFTLFVIVGGGYWYHMYARAAEHGPSGSTRQGLTFGIVAAIFMFYVGALGMRRRYRSFRLGSGRFWLQSHLWLGFLTLPLVWYHAGFRDGAMHTFFSSGGPLTIVIMYLLYAVWLTGLYGIILQQFLPVEIKNKIPNERLWSQIETAMGYLREDAKALAGSTGAIADFYQSKIAPFLAGAPTSSGYLAVCGACNETRAKVDPASTVTVDKLNEICGNYRHLAREKRMLFWLHSWLLIHVPLSMALLLLTAIHIIMAARLVL
jgi:hypothetical protein